MTMLLFFKRVLLLNLVLFTVSSRIFAEDIQNSKSQRLWDNAKISIGVDVGAGQIKYSDVPYFSDTRLVLDLVVRLKLIPRWHLTLIEDTMILSYSSISLLTGYNKEFNNFLWYIEAGINSYFNPDTILYYYPTYLGPQISTGVDWMFVKHFAVGFKINAIYLFDRSNEGLRMVGPTEGGQYRIKDDHFKLQIVLTASYVFD